MDAYRTFSESISPVCFSFVRSFVRSFVPSFAKNLTLFFSAGADCETFLQDFVNGIRRHPALEHAHMVFCGERNTGHETHFLGRVFATHSNCSIISQRGDGDEGWWTTQYNKQVQLHDAERALQCQQVRFMDEWVTAHLFARENPKERREKLLGQLEMELMRYGEHERATRDPASNPSVFVSGRVAEDGSRMQDVKDDLAFCFCFSIWLNMLIARRATPGANYNEIFGLQKNAFSGDGKRKR